MSRCGALLVHGSMHGAWVWSDVQSRLAEQGVATVAVDLPGHGQRWHEARSASMASYTSAVIEAIDDVGKPVVLVGHSMAGQVVARAASHRASVVRRLVLVNAQVLRDGETHAGTLRPRIRHEYRRLARAQGGTTYRLSDRDIHARWLQDLPYDDPRVTRVLSLVTPQPYRPLIERAVDQDFASRGVGVTYSRSTGDAGDPDRMDGFVAKLPRGATLISVPGSHDCMVSEPEALASVLRDVIVHATQSP